MQYKKNVLIVDVDCFEYDGDDLNVGCVHQIMKAQIAGYKVIIMSDGSIEDLNYYFRDTAEVDFIGFNGGITETVNGTIVKHYLDEVEVRKIIMTANKFSSEIYVSKNGSIHCNKNNCSKRKLGYSVIYEKELLNIHDIVGVTILSDNVLEIKTELIPILNRCKVELNAGKISVYSRYSDRAEAVLSILNEYNLDRNSTNLETVGRSDRDLTTLNISDMRYIKNIFLARKLKDFEVFEDSVSLLIKIIKFEERK